MASPLTVHSRAGISTRPPDSLSRALQDEYQSSTRTVKLVKPGHTLDSISVQTPYHQLLLSVWEKTLHAAVSDFTPSTCLLLIPKSSPQVLNKSQLSGTSLAVQWLSLCSSIAGGTGSILGWGN